MCGIELHSLGMLCVMLYDKLLVCHKLIKKSMFMETIDLAHIHLRNNKVKNYKIGSPAKLFAGDPIS